MLLISVLAGLIGSLIGIGGGILVVPILTLLFGVPIPFAIGASIVSVIATSSGSAAAFIKDEITNLRIGMFLEIATAPGAIVGALTALLLFRSNMQWIMYLSFGLVLIFSSYSLYKKGKNENSITSAEVATKRSAFAERLKLGGKYYDASLNQHISYEATRVHAGLMTMLAAGFVSGLLGIGAGVMKVLSMDMMMRLPFKVSTTTSNFMIGVTAVAGTSVFYIGGFINPILVGPVAVGVVLGSFIGAKILIRSKPSSLRLLFMIILVILGLQMIRRGLLFV
jgi:uncharacterized membrane protein YfcA